MVVNYTPMPCSKLSLSNHQLAAVLGNSLNSLMGGGLLMHPNGDQNGTFQNQSKKYSYCQNRWSWHFLEVENLIILIITWEMRGALAWKRITWHCSCDSKHAQATIFSFVLSFRRKFTWKKINKIGRWEATEGFCKMHTNHPLLCNRSNPWHHT